MSSKIVKRDALGRIEKGSSLNPGGRPKAVKDLLAVARASVPEALALANSFVADATMDARVRLEAAKLVLSYGLGAPPKLEDLEDHETAAQYDAMTDEEIDAALELAYLERVRKVTTVNGEVLSDEDDAGAALAPGGV